MNNTIEPQQPLDPYQQIQEMQTSLTAFARQVGELELEIGNFQLIVSLGTQALDLARRTVIAEYRLLMAQEDLERVRQEHSAEMADLRAELERRNVNYGYHQQALAEIAHLREVVATQYRAPAVVHSER